MNESFKLRTTMSPKPLRTKLHVKKRTVLALRKNIRRSSCYDKPPAAIADILYRDECRMIDKLNATPTDSEFEKEHASFDESCAMFADLSIIPKHTTMKAMNSTFIQGRHTQFHELFQGAKNKKISSCRDNKKSSSRKQAQSSDDDVIISSDEDFDRKYHSKDIKTTNKNPDWKRNGSAKVKNNKKSRDSNDLLLSNKYHGNIDVSNEHEDASIEGVNKNNEDHQDEIRKVLDETSGPSWRERKTEVLRTEPRKKISTRINEIHKAVCQTDVKSNSQIQYSQHNLVSQNSKQLFVQEPSIPPKSKNSRRLYYGESESDDELTSKKNFKRIITPKVGIQRSLTKTSTNIQENLEATEQSGSKLMNVHDSERSLKNKSKGIIENNRKPIIDSVVSEKVCISSDSSDSEDELMSKRNFKRIVYPLSVRKGSSKKKDDQENVQNIKVDAVKLKHNKLKLKQGWVTVSASDSEDELLIKKTFKRIVHPKAVKEISRNKNEDNRKDVKIIEDTSRGLENLNCLEDISTTDKTKSIISLPSKELRNSCNESTCIDPEILVISDSDDDSTNINIFKGSLHTERSDNILKTSETIKSEPVEIPEKENDESEDVDEVKKLLDDIYGLSWREREHEVLRTEPKKRVLSQIDNIVKAVAQTEVKKVGTKVQNDHKKLNWPIDNGGIINKNIYTETPEAKCLIAPKHIERRKLFPSVDIDDDDFDRSPEVAPTQKNDAPKIPPQRFNSKATATLRFKLNSDKPSAKSVRKESWPTDLCDSDSERDDVVALGDCSNDSDWETPNDDYLLKYLKNSTQVKANTQKKEKTFLESLSKSVPISETHPTARIFRNDFKKHRDELTTRLFNLFNEKIFDGVIAKEFSSIIWNSRLRGTAGKCRNSKATHRDKTVTRTVQISLSNKVLDSPDRLRDTLIHEMCHAANWIVDGESGHGPSWKKWTIKALTIFPELPPISTCHNYNIATKYTYRCTNCGYSFGRHSKSIAIEKKCCGYCRGKLELLINKKSKSGSVNNATPAPATPARKPSGFALFVQDNYKTCRTPDLKHGDVMRLLSKQFGSLKVEKKYPLHN